MAFPSLLDAPGEAASRHFSGGARFVPGPDLVYTTPASVLCFDERMGDRGRAWGQPVRERNTAQRPGAQDWSQLEPYEEGRAGDLPTDDRALFGDFASQLLEGR